jgi:hypothetical protein
MGSYPSTYIGIYVEVPIAVKKVEKTIYKNPTTGLETRYAFDPKTGEKANAETTLVDEDTYPSPFDFSTMDGFDDELFFSPAYDGAGEGKKTFVINYHNSRFRMPTENEAETFNIEFPYNLNIKELIAEFIREHGKYIEYWQKEYGPIAVKYGIVHYYH